MLLKSRLLKSSHKAMLFLTMLFLTLTVNSFAHCDSYDGPVIKDAKKALEANNVNLVLKWIDTKHEQEIISLFNKTFSLKKGDKEIYAIVEKHFFETLVRFHREKEGEPFTGLKPAGTTKKIVQLSDQAIAKDSIDNLLGLLNNHISQVIREKFEKVEALDKVKDESVEKGREYVEAYINYVHTIEAIHDILENDGVHSAHNH